MQRQSAPKASSADCEKSEAFERSGVRPRRAFHRESRHEVPARDYDVILGQTDKTQVDVSVSPE
jgi:hypothetical protein